jgi:caffeoyl-CoA O-methyltransferase
MRTNRWISLGLVIIGLGGGLALGSRILSIFAAEGPPAAGRVDLDKLLDDLYQYGLKNSMWNIRPGDGRFLQILVASSGAKRVLELGTSNGYSGIWIGRALQETGGKLTTVEIDEGRWKEAKANFEKAGMAGLIDARLGDAAKVIPTLTGPFDLIFMDTEKGDYLAQYRLALPLLRPGGLFLSHNVVLLKDSMKDFLKEIESSPSLVTAIAQTSDDGFSVTYKKR